MTALRDLLFAEPYRFDFFQAVRVLERALPDRKPVGLYHTPEEEVVQFRAQLSLAFPASAVHELLPPEEDRSWPLMTVTFLGLYGPSGALPTHYTQMLLELHRDVRGPERRSLRDFLDLFNHRLTSVFYRAWEKYRFYIPYERGEPFRPEPDAFTQALFSAVGLGLPPLRNRLRVEVPVPGEAVYPEPARVLAKVDDLALLYYGGILAQRPPNAANLAILLRDYFGLPAEVQQFQGQWLPIDPADQTCLGSHGMLGVNAIAGARVWDVQSRFRLRLGPLNYEQFQDFLPDRAPIPQRKSLFMLIHLARLFVGPELDFDVQLVLAARSVPRCELNEGSALGARLGWNAWLVSRPMPADADDPVFEGEVVTTLAG